MRRRATRAPPLSVRFGRWAPCARWCAVVEGETRLSDFATYDDIMEMMDDRDDSSDAEFRNPDGYCPHGVYVGGCGVDLMCGWCEDGISVTEARSIVRAERMRATRKRAECAALLLAALLSHGMGGIDAAHFAQESSHIGNPRSRYGRH
jgi:hypothetical protein